MISVFIGLVIGLLVFFLCRSRDRRKIDRLTVIANEQKSLLEQANNNISEKNDICNRQRALLDSNQLALNKFGPFDEEFETLKENYQCAQLRIQELEEEVRLGKEMEKALFEQMIELVNQAQKARAKSIEHLQARENTLAQFN